MLSTAKAIAAISLGFLASPAACEQELCTGQTCSAETAHQGKAVLDQPTKVFEKSKDPYSESQDILVARKKLLNAGGELNGVAIVDLDSGMKGLALFTDMPAGAPLVFVPKELLLDSDRAYKLPVVQYLVEEGIFNQIRKVKKDVLATTVLLLHEQYLGDESEWKWFLDTLPQSMEEHPLLYTPDEIHLLDGTQAQARIASTHHSLRKAYKLISDSVEGFSDRHSWAQFLHAYLLVATRSFVSTEGTKPTTMAPLADMANHSTQANAEWVFAIRDRAYDKKKSKGGYNDHASGLVLYISDALEAH